LDTSDLSPKNERELIFVKNEQGLVRDAIIHDPGMPDSEGKKVSDSATRTGNHFAAFCCACSAELRRFELS
jgi:hypothetical protein